MTADIKEIALKLAQEADPGFANNNGSLADSVVGADAIERLVRAALAHAYRDAVEEWEKPYGIAPSRFIDRLRAKADEMERGN